MPLHDHFRPPLDDLRPWDGFHGGWPMMIAITLRQRLPLGYFAMPLVHSGRSVEIDVATYEGDEGTTSGDGATNGNNGGVATAVWAPTKPTLATATDLPTLDTYEVLVYDEKRQNRLVAAVEIVSPANKDRPEHRQAFVAKCVALLQKRISVVIVDIVTTRTQNLSIEMLESIGLSDPNVCSESLYTVSYRLTKRDEEWSLEAWYESLTLGKPLPTMPLWLADNLAVPLELEKSYEQCYQGLGLPRV